MYNVLNEKGNLIIRHCRHLIPANEKFIVKHNYDNIIKPSETTSQKTLVQTKTDIPSNITTSPVRTKSGRLIKKPKRYLEECWIVKHLCNTYFWPACKVVKLKVGDVTLLTSLFMFHLISFSPHFIDHVSFLILSVRSPSHSPFLPQSISFMFTLFGCIHITWSFNLIVSFTFQPIPSLEINNLQVSLDKFLILDRYSLLEADLQCFYYSLPLYIKQEIKHWKALNPL